MKKLLAALALACASLCAQPSCITLTDTIYSMGPSGSALMTGFIELKLGYFTSNGGFTITQSLTTLSISAKSNNLSACLTPSTVVQANYTVTTGGRTPVHYTTYWYMPNTGGPYQLTSVPSGVVNVTGTPGVVTWQSGLNFKLFSPNDTPTINTSSVSVASVQGVTQLTLYSGLGTLVNATLTNGPIERGRPTTGGSNPPSIYGPAGPAGPAGVSAGPFGVTMSGWTIPYGMPGGSWAWNYNQKGEHGIVKSSLLYVPLENNTTLSDSGLGIIDPATGVMQKYVSIPTFCMEAAPAFDNSGFLHMYSCSSSTGGGGGFLSKVNVSTGAVVNTLTFAGSVDWEKVTYDPVHDTILQVIHGVGLSAVKASDYTTLWTNTDVNVAAGGGGAPAGPILVNGSYAYWRDFIGGVYKINLATGATAASNTSLTTGFVGVYANLSYDSVNSKLYGTTQKNIVFALNVSDLSIAWTRTVDDNTFSFDRGGAYANGVYYVTDRNSNSPYASKVYAISAANGTVLWTNTSAYDVNGEISSLLVGDHYVYASTTSYIGDAYDNELLINISDGTLAQTIPLLHRVSSSIPVAWGGRLIQGLWDQYGYQAMQLWTGGTTSDWTYKADENQSGYTGTQFSGTLSSFTALTNQVPANGALLHVPAFNLPSHYVLGTCGSIVALTPCRLGPTDMTGGFTGTKTAGSCTLTLVNGIVTNITGC